MYNMPKFFNDHGHPIVSYFDNETHILDDSDSENEAEEIEMAEEEIVENVKFKKETKLDFDQRNCRSGFSFPVVPEKMKEKGIGIDINLITPEIADSPEQIYS